jgi:hypothetical protein
MTDESTGLVGISLSGRPLDVEWAELGVRGGPGLASWWVTGKLATMTGVTMDDLGMHSVVLQATDGRTLTGEAILWPTSATGLRGPSRGRPRLHPTSPDRTRHSCVGSTRA